MQFAEIVGREPLVGGNAGPSFDRAEGKLGRAFVVGCGGRGKARLAQQLGRCYYRIQNLSLGLPKVSDLPKKWRLTAKSVILGSLGF